MNNQEPAVYVPQPGEVVLIEWARRGIHDAVGDVVRVEHAELHPNVGCIILTGIGTRAEERRYWYRDAFCRVRPIRSAIDVECPHVTDWQRFGLHPCGGTVGNPCSTMALARPMDIGCSHGARRDLFLSLTGQAPKDSDTKKREPGCKCDKEEGDSPCQVHGYDEDSATPSGVVTPVGPEPEGDSGTGRAAGSGAILSTPQPAAPSSFRAPTDVYDVDCEACGAKGARSHTVDRTAAFCHEDGRRVEPHALRVAAFEARCERGALVVYAAACTNCSGDKRREVQSYAAMHLTFNTGLCGDCAAVANGYGDRQARVDKLRADLDRPLPPKPDALKTWPEHWATPGWES